MNCLGLIELSDPLSFDPVGPVTSVFYDIKNQQVFSVRSGGATGIVIKSPGKPQKTLVLEDKGPILSIKFSTDQKLLSIQRSKSSLDIHNMDSSGQVDPGHYSLSPKNKNSLMAGYFWNTGDELVTISDTGIDLYVVISAKKLVKYVRSSSTTVSWYKSNTSPNANIIITSSKQETASLQVWSVKNSNIFKLPVIELSGFSVKEKDVSIIHVYGRSYIAVNIVDDGLIKGIQLYSTDNDQVMLAYCLSVSVAGHLGLHTLDNLILVHSFQSSGTFLFDIACSTSKQKCKDSCTPIDDTPILPQTCITEKGCCMPYSPTWLLFLPNILLDARNGELWTLGLKLKRAECEDPVDLCRFYLHRTGGKPHLLAHLKEALHGTSTSLQQFSSMFHEIVLAYCLHQKQDLPNIPGVSLKSGLGFEPAVVLDQSEIYTTVLSPAQKEGIDLHRLHCVLVELLLTLSTFNIKPRQFILELFINLAVKTEQYYQMHQYVQYGVITDSKHLACILLSLESVYPPARQIALDMMSRLGNAVEELLEICLAEGKVIQAINLASESGLGDTISSRKYLEACKHLDDLTFFNVFSFFEERNLRLRGSARFSTDEKCDEFVQKFNRLFI